MGPPEKEAGPLAKGPANAEGLPTTTSTADSSGAGRQDCSDATHNGHKPNGLRATLEAAGRSLKSLTVLSPQNDPFRVDTPAGHRDGAWLANTLDQLRIRGQRHLRGLHYILIGQPKPDGQPYTNTDRDWQWLGMTAKAARWNRYIPFNRIIDARNDEPVIRIRERPEHPWRSLSVRFDALRILDADDLTPRVWLHDFAATQRERLVLVGEKSSLRPVLDPLSERYHTDLFLPTGEISDTQAHSMARAASADGRPMVVLYFSDCDPSGWQMPISLARKLQGLKAIEFDNLDFRIYRVGLIPEQVREHALPSTPLKDAERLAALQPDLLRRITEDAMAPFYDTTLDRRVRQAINEWQQLAQRAVDEQSVDHRERLHADVIPLLEAKRAEIEEMLDSIRLDVGDFGLPPVPAVPQPIFDEELTPDTTLCDSVWGFAEQCERLRASKNYDGEGQR